MKCGQLTGNLLKVPSVRSLQLSHTLSYRTQEPAEMASVSGGPDLLSDQVSALKIERVDDWIPSMADPHQMIRLLKMPESVDEGGDIALELKTYTWTALPEYYTFSYTWGCPYTRDLDPTSDEITRWEALTGDTTVICNGRKVHVTRNLLHGLQNIAHAFAGALMWIDALCINQRDDAEKLVQIQIMDRIYQRAEATLIWPGRIKGSLVELNKLYQKSSPLMRAIRWSLDPSKTRQVRMQLLDGLTMDRQVQALNDVLRLFSQSWWSRKWTFQELIMTKSSFFVYNDTLISTLQLYLMLEILRNSDIDDRAKLILNTYNRGQAYARLRYAFKITQLRDRPDLSIPELEHCHGAHSFMAILVELMTKTTLAHASEPRDNIISLVGVCKMLALRLNQPVDLDFLDYPSAGALNLIVTKKAILELPILSVFRFADYVMTEARQPSWLPSYQDSYLGTRNNYQFDVCPIPAQDRQEVLSKRRFDLSVDPGLPSPKPERLELQAVKIGTIESKFVLPLARPEAGRDTHRKCELVKAMITFCRQLPRKYWHDCDPGDGIFQTLFYGSKTMSRDMFRSWASIGLYHCSILSRGDVATCLAGIKSATGVDHAAVLGFDVIDETVKLAYEAASSPAAFERADELVRRWSRSEMISQRVQSLLMISGEQVGITIARCEVTDQIWVLRGGKHPFVLRPTSQPGHFLLIGEAYVDGIMQGELARDNDGRLDWQSIWLV